MYSGYSTPGLATLTPRSVDSWQPASPSLSKYRNRIPKSMSRWLPCYLAFVLIVVVVLNADWVFGSASTYYPLNRRGHDREARPVSGFPKKVWQTWKVDPLNFEERDLKTAQTWTGKNPGFRYEVLTDYNDMAYVEDMYGPDGFDRPDIVDFYRTINATIIKADLLRYMVLFAEGGVYADIDVEALKPVSKFIPDHKYDEHQVDMVIGIEIDQPDFKDHPILGPKSQSFCQWTFMARPHLPVMMRLIENIMTWLHRLAVEQRVAISDVELDFDAVISGTGPSAFTSAILEDMNENRRKGEPKVTWDTFHDLDESKIVSRILVLNVEAFAAGQGHSGSGNHDSRGAMVKHHYHASNWPSKHPRFAHPAYGPVEACNWEEACVKKWDDNVAAFALLSPEAQEAKQAEIEAEEKRQNELLKEQALFAFRNPEDLPPAPEPAKDEPAKDAAPASDDETSAEEMQELRT